MKLKINFIHSRVARRIFILFIISAMLPVCLLALFSLHKVSSRIQEEGHERLRQVCKNAGMTIHEGMNLLQTELESTPITDHRDRLRSASGGFTTHRAERFRRIYVTKKDGVACSLNGNPRRLTDGELAHLEAGDSVIIASPDLGVGDPIYMLTSMNPNLPSNSILVGEINPNFIWTYVGYTLPSAVNICVLGPTGKQLYRTIELPHKLVSLVMSNKNGSSTSHFQWKEGDYDYLVSYWSVFMKPAFLTDTWTVIVVQSWSDSMGPIRPFIKTFILVILLAIFVVIFFSSSLIRRSLVPLSTLRDGARRLSRGDFSSRVDITSGDEFEELAESFNDMSRQLGKQFTKLGEMGKLIQSILEAHNRDSLIETVMSCFRDSVPCQWLAVSLQEGKSGNRFLAYYNRDYLNSKSRTLQLEMELSEGELEKIRNAYEGLHVTGSGVCVALLTSLSAEGGREFYIFPITIKDRLLGFLILGYVHLPDHIGEDLVRTRQISDEIAVAMDNIRLIDELNLLNWGTVQVLASAVDAKSPWTAGHSMRVTMLSMEIAVKMGVTGKDLEILHWAGLFHDMGKIAVPEYILDKPGRLTDEEFAIIKRHPSKGGEILLPIQAYHDAIPIVEQHHERYDGKGYPAGVAGKDICLGARILAVADVFDALFSDRPYRKGWEIGKVISYIEHDAGSSFDPEIVKVFMGIDLSAYFDLLSKENPMVNGFGVESSAGGAGT